MANSVNNGKPPLELSLREFAKEAKHLMWTRTPNVADILQQAGRKDGALSPDSVWLLSWWIKREMAHQMMDNTHTQASLASYDAVIWYFNCPLLWGIRRDQIQQLYDDCLQQSKLHAEVGARTGFFLKNLQSTSELQEITLLAKNPTCLDVCEENLHMSLNSKFKIERQVMDVLKSPPPELHGKFDSVGCNYFLHCLHGGRKIILLAVKHCAALLKPETGTFHNRMALSLLVKYTV